MHITAVELALLRVPLKNPFRTALRTVHAVEDIVVLLRTDAGPTGHGSAAPTAAITGETHGSIIDAIRHGIAPRLVGRPIADLNTLVHATQTALAHNTSAKAAVEIALYDLWAQYHGAPLYRLLGGGTPVLSTDLTISVDAIDAMVAAARAAVERGYTALKIKLGLDAAADVERVRAIHAAVQGRACLRLDANQGWTPKQAVAVLRRIEADGIPLDLLEQPVPAQDIEGLKYVADHVQTPVMADEAVFGPAEAVDLLHRRAADIVNIKLMKAGGLSHAARIADIAATFGAPCMIGCMIESGIGITAAAHLAVAKSGTITRVDLDAPSLCVANPLDGGATFDGPAIRLGDAAGLGIRGIDGLAPIEA